LASVEALVRWTHPEHGPISPTLFIPYAESNGLIGRIGTWALGQACRDALAWQGLSVAVNVSPLQFRDPGFVPAVFDIADEVGFPLNRLELEITEGAVFDEPVKAEAAMRLLRESRIRLALDDFGTGYTSLAYLRRMPWDKVKIDKSFVDDVKFVTSAAIVHAIVALGRAIGLKVTAEGIETKEQHQFLRIAGCHYMQGYYFSKPVPASVIGRMNAIGFARYRDEAREANSRSTPSCAAACARNT
jgi:EAL domain-containing protein (putative c-di-GMP-specific phosphodiesterase class I)